MSYPSVVGEPVSLEQSITISQENGTSDTLKYIYTAPIPNSHNFVAIPDSNREWKWPKSDISSFSKIKKSGAIKFSDYSIGKERTTNHIQRVQSATYFNDCNTRWSWNSEGKIHDSGWIEGAVESRFEYQGDLQGFRSLFPTAPHNVLSLDSYEKDVETLKGNVVTAMNSEYDFLTELAELKSTLAYLLSVLQKVRHPLQSFRDAKKALDKKDWKGKSVMYHDALTSLWMQYRYAIMPLVYSAQDIKSVIEHRSDIYRTERGFSRINLDETSRGKILERTHFYDVVEGSITLRATGKARYSSDVNLRLADSIGTNFAVTAWELIPYSFVVDWFVNIGDFLSSHLSSWASLAEERHFVYSVKKQYSVSTFLHYYNDTRSTFEYPVNIQAGTVVRPALSWPFGEVFRDDVLLQKKIVDTYDRVVFQPSDVRLVFNPFMNWKRWLDAYVLSSANARNALRKLKS